MPSKKLPAGSLALVREGMLVVIVFKWTKDKATVCHLGSRTETPLPKKYREEELMPLKEGIEWAETQLGHPPAPPATDPVASKKYLDELIARILGSK